MFHPVGRRERRYAFFADSTMLVLRRELAGLNAMYRKPKSRRSDRPLVDPLLAERLSNTERGRLYRDRRRRNVLFLATLEVTAKDIKALEACGLEADTPEKFAKAVKEVLSS
jgi:hypothetical protein